MKKHLLFALMLCFHAYAFSQHPLYGTWKIISVKGTDPEGKAVFLDNSMVRETKIITPTHFMLLAEDVKGDSILFNRCYGGRIKMDGNKYYEMYELGSNETPENVKSDFTWKVVGDTFTQSGSVTFPDGKKYILDEIIFTRVKSEHAYPNNPAIGTWEQLSSSYVWDDVKNAHTNATATRYHIITPTHWMRISHRDNKFESAMCGTYTMTGDKGEVFINYASFPLENGVKYEYTQKIAGNKMTMTGKMLGASPKERSWNDVFQRVNPNSRLDNVTKQ